MLIEELNQGCALMLAEVLVVHNLINHVTGIYMIMTNEYKFFLGYHLNVHQVQY